MDDETRRIMREAERIKYDSDMHIRTLDIVTGRGVSLEKMEEALEYFISLENYKFCKIIKDKIDESLDN